MIYVTWFFIGVVALSSALNILEVGKPRKPNTPGTALAIVVVNLALIYTLLWWLSR